MEARVVNGTDGWTVRGTEDRPLAGDNRMWIPEDNLFEEEREAGEAVQLMSRRRPVL